MVRCCMPPSPPCLSRQAPYPICSIPPRIKSSPHLYSCLLPVRRSPPHLLSFHPKFIRHVQPRKSSFRNVTRRIRRPWAFGRNPCRTSSAYLYLQEYLLRDSKGEGSVSYELNNKLTQVRIRFIISGHRIFSRSLCSYSSPSSSPSLYYCGWSFFGGNGGPRPARRRKRTRCN